jgi:hypothetical protein
MTARMVTPAVYPITIPRRATYRQRFQLPFDCTGHDLYAQVWTTIRRTKKLLDFSIEWIDQADGVFDLVGDSPDTERVSKDGYWDLLVVYPNGESDYWLRGPATVDIGYTANPENV